MIVVKFCILILKQFSPKQQIIKRKFFVNASYILLHRNTLTFVSIKINNDLTLYFFNKINFMHIVEKE